MRYRFKYSKQAQGRKSAHCCNNNSVKNDALIYINLLDKCTQILREDRIWVRNQLKAADPHIIAIFKSAKKPINLQHLQIRLRKHLASVKSKAKMEQLMRFKENMQLGDFSKHKDPELSYHDTHSHHPNKSFSTAAQHSMNQSNCRSSRQALNSSLQKTEKSMIYPYRNKSGAHSTSNRKNTCEYQVPMEEITERESENMTSARHRIMCQEPANQGYSFGVNCAYTQWKRPEPTASPLDNLRKQISPCNRLNNYVEQRSAEILYPKRDKEDTQSKHLFEEYHSSKEEQSNSGKKEGRVPERGSSQTNWHCPVYEFGKDHHSNADEKSYLENSQESVKHITSPQSGRHDCIEFENYQRPEPQKGQRGEETSLLGQTQTFSYSHDNMGKQENLFTSPELLRECRNFIKSKSGAKSLENTEAMALPVHNEVKYTPLVFEGSVNHSLKEPKESMADSHTRKENLQDTMSRPFSNINCGFIESVKVSEPASNSKLLQLQEHEPPQNHAPDAGHDQRTYQYFHTFAGQSSQKQPPTRKLATAEQFIDIVIESASDGEQGFVNWLTLLKIIERKCPEFLETFVEYLQPEQGEHVLISNAGRVMEDLLQNQKEHENEVRSIYNLLDIDRKGFITQEDVQEFISKLEDAEVEEVGSISNCLWRFYASIDEDSDESEQKRIDYWGVYARKMGAEFQDVNEILKQFEFEIE